MSEYEKSEYEEFDLYFIPNDSPSLRVELMSRKFGRLATLVDSSSRDMWMCRVSVVDHLTEPRDLTKYVIEPLAGIPGAVVDSLPPGAWVLSYQWGNDGLTTLGCTSDEAGAQSLLTYLKRQDTRCLH